MADDTDLRGVLDEKTKAKAAADALFQPPAPETPAPAQSPALRAGESVGTRESVSTSAPIAMTPEQQAQARQVVKENHAPARAAVQRAKALEPKIKEGYHEAVSTFATNAETDQQEADRIIREGMKPLIEQADKADANYQKALEGRVKYRAQTQQQIERMDTLAKHIASQQPRDIWTDASVPVKIAGIAAMALGGAAQAIWGDKTNAVTDQIEAAVKQDLMMQRLRLDKGKEDFANQNLLLKQFMVEGEHIEHSEDKALSTAMMGIAGRLKMMKTQLASPEMRRQLDMQIGELQMKAAGAYERVAINTAGMDVRQAEAEALAADHATTSNGRLEATRANAETAKRREDRLATQHGEKMDEKRMPGWDFPDGYFGSVPEFTKLREAESTIMSAVDRLKVMSKDLGAGIKNLHSWAGYKQLKQDYAAVTEAAKGAGLMNAGANFTKLEEDLIEAGYMNTMYSIIDPKGAQALIKRKIEQLWKDVAAKVHERGGRAKGHSVFQDE